MTNSIFITATGTDIGKTYVSGLLVKYLRQNNINCGYYKPVLSGACENIDGSLYLGDAEFVVDKSGLCCDASTCVSYSFNEPLSPHLASSRQGVKILSEKILNDYNNLSAQYEFLVVEGAGGITCPFSLEEDYSLLLSDIMCDIAAPIIIVADAGLGTINSTLLTVEYAKNKGLEVLGIILNNYDQNNFMHIDNKLQIEKLTNSKVIATVGYNSENIDIDRVVLDRVLRAVEV